MTPTCMILSRLASGVDSVAVWSIKLLLENQGMTADPVTPIPNHGHSEIIKGLSLAHPFPSFTFVLYFAVAVADYS